jgi:hypothetical protein
MTAKASCSTNAHSQRYDEWSPTEASKQRRDLIAIDHPHPMGRFDSPAVRGTTPKRVSFCDNAAVDSTQSVQLCEEGLPGLL